MFDFKDLDDNTRKYMLIEVDQAVKASQLNLSKRFNDTGIKLYPQLLREAVANGTEETLAAALQKHQCFNSYEKRGAVMRKVPENAATTFAEGEFNGFYMRGVCHRAIQEGQMVQVYRAKESEVHRKGSELIEGNLEDPKRVLLIIRNSLDGSQRGPGMPAGSNSGLSIRLTNTPIK